ncbi:hypothetical protein [Kineococcus aurantiacus]|uniref:Uncharacterized protein n=1 Tax=Kineococcus aurantiacus TaxID=37633 RepID=A0A7Y9DNV5_9ACTN|nr:hypothetical protein [Kineococcus aurantiacus]NYD24070.1 hypothetical protein [Kineococcus aurantiacus]
MPTDLPALLVLLVLVVLALAAPRFGADTRTSRAWSDADPLPYPVQRR